MSEKLVFCVSPLEARTLGVALTCADIPHVQGPRGWIGLAETDIPRVRKLLDSFTRTLSAFSIFSEWPYEAQPDSDVCPDCGARTEKMQTLEESCLSWCGLDYLYLCPNGHRYWWSTRNAWERTR